MNDEDRKSIYALFAGPIDQSSVQRVFNGFAVAMGNGFNDIHVLFQSFGGTVSDGVCLFNFFRSLPVDLTLYNAGNVSSAATIAYMGAKRRKASAYATFMLHRTQTAPQSASAERLHSVAHSVAADDARLENIVRSVITLTDEQWAIHRYADLWLTAEDAAKCGLAGIGEFAPPVGTQLFSI